MQMRVRIVLRGAEALKAFQLGLFGGETHVAEKGKRRGFSGDPTHGGKLTATKKTTSGGVTRTYYTAPEAAPAGQPGLQPAQPQQPAPAAAQRVPDGIAPPDPKDPTRVDFSQRRSTDAELDDALKRHGGNVRQAAKFIRDGEPGNAHHADLEQRLLGRVKANMPPEQREAIERAKAGAQEHDAQADKHRQAAADWGGRDTPEGKAHLAAQSAHRSAADAHRNSLNGAGAKTDPGSPEQAQKAAEKARAATAKAPHLDPVQHHLAEMGKHHEAAQRLAKAPMPNLAAVTAHIRARDIHEAAAGTHRRGSTPDRRVNASTNARAATEAAQMAEHGDQPQPTSPPAGKSVKLSGAASGEFDMLREQHADPEGHGLDDDEREAVGHLVSHHDPDRGHLRLPDDPEVADKMAKHVGALASSYGDQLQDKVGEASHAEGRDHVKRAMGALEGLRDTLNTHAQGLRSKVATGAADTKRQEHEQKAAAHAAEAAKLPAEDPVGVKHREAALAHEKAARWHGNVGKVGGAERAAALLSEQAHDRTRDVDTVKQRMGERDKTRQAEDPAYRAAQTNAQQRQALDQGHVRNHFENANEHGAKRDAARTPEERDAHQAAVEAHDHAATMITRLGAGATDQQHAAAHAARQAAQAASDKARGVSDALDKAHQSQPGKFAPHVMADPHNIDAAAKNKDRAARGQSPLPFVARFAPDGTAPTPAHETAIRRSIQAGETVAQTMERSGVDHQTAKNIHAKYGAPLKTTKTPKGGRTGHVQAIMDEVIKPAMDAHAKHPDNSPAGQEAHRGHQLMAQHFNAETESFAMPSNAKDAHDLAEALREYAGYARSHADEAENRGDRAYHNTAAKHLDDHAKQMQAHADTLGAP